MAVSSTAFNQTAELFYFLMWPCRRQG